MRTRILPLAAFLLAFLAPVHADDWAVNAKYFGLTFHPDGGENEGYPRQLDDGAYWVLQVGAQVDVDRKLLPWLTLRTSHALYRDCADVWAGFHNVSLRLDWEATDRVGLRFGVGPTVLWRQNWLGRVAGYRRDSFFGAADSSSDFQSAFLWYGGDIEASYRIGERWGVVVSMIPGWPEVITTAVGVRRTF